MSAPLIFGILFFILGIYMFWKSLAALKIAKLSNNWPHVTGQITRFNVSKPQATSEHRILYVEYDYWVKDKKYTGTRDAFYTLLGQEVLELEQQFKDSQDVIVYFDPNSPQSCTLIVGAREDKKYSDLILSFLGILVGGGLSIAAYFGHIG